MPNGIRVIMLGRQGAGKGTQCRRLADHYGVPHISTGEMLRAAVRQDSVVGRAVKAVLDAGKLVDDAMMISLVQGRIGQEDARVAGYLLDGFPRTVAQAESFDEITAARPVTVVVDLVVERDLVLDRLSARRTCENCEANYVSTGNDPNPWTCDSCGGAVRQRADDTPEAINRRLDLYDSQTAPLVDYYRSRNKLVAVDGLGTPDEVFARLQRAVETARNA
jgi:adenylate kinase